MERQTTKTAAEHGIDSLADRPEVGSGWVRDEFVALASHELKTPLTSLKLQVQTMKHLVDREPAASPAWAATMLVTFDRQIGRLASLVEDLLLTTRIQAGELTPAPEDVDLGALVREVVADVVAQGRISGASFTLELEEGLGGSWDRRLLARVLFHLFKNAVTFGGHRPITVAVHAEPGHAVRITVRDHGAGIAAEDLERIFDCFERAAPVEHFGGLGIGLYLARTIVRAHGGSIGVESEPGRGTTFTVELPLAATEVREAVLLAA
jgi:signal transduction histidine kinase